jgi:glycosyltransferase involved in cell wall biosynthesis
VTVATEHLTYHPRTAVHQLLIDSLLARTATQVVAVAEAVREATSARTGLPQNRVMVISNPLPLEEIPLLSETEKRAKRAALKLGVTQPVVIAIGRLEPEKGFPILIKAARAVVQQLPHAAFLIAGQGSMEAELHELVNGCGLDRSVQLLGFRQDVYELLQISDVLAMPSFSEGLPMVLLEAGGCRVPVVASSVGGIPELIAEGVNGILVPPGDSDVMGIRLLELLSDPGLRARMGEAGRNIVKNRFCPGRIAERLRGIYDRHWLDGHGPLPNLQGVRTDRDV